MLELHGILAQTLGDLDGHSEEWRRIYFLRASVRTLWEIQGCLTTIRMNREFKRMLAKRTQQERRELKEICSKLNSASDVTRTIRDALGGHVLHSAVEKALNNLAYDHWGILEVGPSIKDTYFKMAGELVAEIFTDGVPELQKVPKIETDIRTISELLPVVQRLEQVLLIYVESRGLL
jgi:hypothetical protein